MKQQEIRWGIMGCGGIAHRFAAGVAAADGSILAAVASRTPGKASQFAAKYQVATFFGSYEELAARSDIDAIYVATTHNYHYECVKLALEQGKAVLCEKPFTVNAREAKKLIALARSRKLFLMEGMWTRFLPAIVQTREWLAEKRIGEIRRIRADFGFKMPFDPKHRLFNPDLAGGALLDAGIYPLSFASMVMNSRPASIRASAEIGSTGVDEQSAYLLTYPHGALAVLTSAVNTEIDCSAIIYGTKGKIVLPSRFLAAAVTELSIDGKPADVRKMPFPVEEGFSFEIEAAASCIRNGETESPVMPPAESLELMETIDEIKHQLGLVYGNDRG